MNRDERHEREQEKPPARHWENDILAPLDPPSNGTWVAVNTKTKNWGALLNGYTDYTPPVPPSSRGTILPFLLNQSNPQRILLDMDLSSYNSFRLILDAQLFFWDGETLAREQFQGTFKNKETQFTFQTSSSYRQDDVIAVRQTLFEHWLEDGAHLTSEGIPTLHLNSSPNAATAILMHRDYSRTKSLTHLHIGKETTMLHWGSNNHKLPSI